jgi:uncharacterized protein (DUF885 family)
MSITSRARPRDAARAVAVFSLAAAAVGAPTATLAATEAVRAAEPAGVPPAPAAHAPKPTRGFERWSDHFAADWVALAPERASATQYFSGSEQKALDRQLAPRTLAQRRKTMTLARAGLARLERFLAGPLEANERISAQTMRSTLANVLAGERFEDHSFVFSQMSGVHVALITFMTETHPLRSAADIDSYLARLAQISVRLDEAIVLARGAAARALIPPRFILERAQGQVAAFLAPAPDQNVLVTSLAERSAALGELSAPARDAALASATRIVASQILPAYRRVQTLLAELHPRTGDAAGIARLPDGAAAYRQALASYTGTALTPEQIHAIGLREVARIEALMDGHLRRLGLTEGSIAQRMRALDETFQPPTEPDPRPLLLARYRTMVRDAELRSAALFETRPRAPVEVRREPALTEGSASAHYSLPAPDGSRPGIFWVPMRGPRFDMIRMRSLAYHEAVPGHHFQLAIQQQTEGLPKYRSQRIFGGGSAHSEGWALYAERLAVEQGWYQDDIPGLLGALGSELFRARRLVVDTGLHSMGWSRQQAIDYGIGAAEVERYVVWPGQACAYMLGMLRIVELRDKAQAALGPAFSLPAFHGLVLRTGSVPLEVLAEVVEQWVAAQSPARATRG